MTNYPKDLKGVQLVNAQEKENIIGRSIKKLKGSTTNTTTEAVIEKILEIQCDKRLQDTVKNGDIESLSVVKCEIPRLDYVVFVKGSGPHDIQYDYQQERPPKEIIVSSAFSFPFSCHLSPILVYVLGILACSAHVEKGDLVAVSVDPQYLERDGLYIGQGTTTMSRAGIFLGLSGLGVDMTDRVFRFISFNDVMKGDIFLQNLPSIITAHIHKKEKGEVIAVDRSHDKVFEIYNLVAELGLTSIKAYKLDAACSALGLRPRLFAGEDTVESLRKHGKCTINPRENEALVRYALDTYKFLSLAQQDPRIGGPGLVGHCELSNGYFEEWLRAAEENLVQRFDPSGPHDTIGFLIAKFIVVPKD
ncbi:rRNA (cytosine-C(5))-methyltransferase NOP2C-like [Lactuca sativa]|uniref:rRNA (cytosine-C(5))-methyltransferase NOP2C-like n=1 Tax=Lactuca sativa TaxID=4236 RepID=UPI0022B0566C|nr:rRNA (cytosine-C(5))-methyltransferase NOP2C-like [Lactuca sativa]